MFSSKGMSLKSNKNETSNKYGGESEKVIATLEGGQKVMIKQSFNGNDDLGNTFAEKFAYHLGSLIGIPVNRVEIIDNGDVFDLEKICSVHFWEDDLKLYSSTRNEERSYLDSNERLIEIFDNIIYNTDRHGGNYGLVNGDVFLIDNGLARPFDEFNRDSTWENNKIDYCIKCYNMNKRCRDVIDTFISLTEEQLSDIGIPPQLEKKFSWYVSETVVRMKTIQEMFKKKIDIYSSYSNEYKNTNDIGTSDLLVHAN